MIRIGILWRCVFPFAIHTELAKVNVRGRRWDDLSHELSTTGRRPMPHVKHILHQRCYQWQRGVLTRTSSSSEVYKWPVYTIVCLQFMVLLLSSFPSESHRSHQRLLPFNLGHRILQTESMCYIAVLVWFVNVLSVMRQAVEFIKDKYDTHIRVIGVEHEMNQNKEAEW